MKTLFLMLGGMFCFFPFYSMDPSEESLLLSPINNPSITCINTTKKYSQQKASQDLPAETSILNLSNKQLNQNLNSVDLKLKATQLRFNAALITTLVLDHNQLPELSPINIKELVNLKKISVAHNKLTMLDLGAWFNTFRCIKTLNFSHNVIDSIEWSHHKPWELSDDHIFKLPIIDVSGNATITHENIKNNLNNRYQEELQRIAQHRYPYSCFLAGTSTFIGIVAGYCCGILPLYILPHIPSWAFAIPQPTGCLLANISSCVGTKICYNQNIDTEISFAEIPLYFDNQSHKKSTIYYDYAPHFGMSCTCLYNCNYGDQ